MAKSLQTISVAEAATMDLRETIFAGEYKCGEEIKDTHIAEKYGIAKPTARVAVQQLINDGLLVREPGYSARVRTFNPAEVQDLFRLRKLVELDAVTHIKQHGGDLREAEEALGGFLELGDAPKLTDLAKADTTFHGAVVRAGGSPRLEECFNGIAKEFRLLLTLPEKRFGRGSSPYEEHQELLTILAGDSSLTQVKKAWKYHIDESRDYFVELLSKQLGS